MEILTPLVELSDSSDTHDIEIDLLPYNKGKHSCQNNSELALKVTELESSLNLVKINSEIEINKIIQKYKEKVHKLNKDLKKTYQVITKKDDLILSIQKEINLIRLSFENTMKERNQLLDKVTKLEKNYEDFYSCGIQKILTDLSSPAQSPGKSLKITNEESQFFIPSPDKLFKKSQDIYSLSSRLAETEMKIKKLKNFEKIDKLVNSALQTLGLKGLLKISDEAVYSLGNKKLNIYIKENTAYVKYGGVSKSLESFLSSSCGQEISSFLKTRKSGNSSTNKTTTRSSFGNEKGYSLISPVHRSLDREVQRNPICRGDSKLMKKLKKFEPLSQNLIYRNV